MQSVSCIANYGEEERDPFPSQLFIGHFGGQKPCETSDLLQHIFCKKPDTKYFQLVRSYTLSHFKSALC